MRTRPNYVPPTPKEINGVIPNRSTDLLGLQNMELGAASKSHSVVITNRRDDQGPVQDTRHDNCILKLRRLITEPAMRCVPEELLVEDRGLALWELDARSFGKG
ncbi:hypothetical protein SLE2022_226470 [Rubroshorea leprosula]